MNLAVRLKSEALRSLAAAAITSSYVAVGDPLLHPARIVFIQNLTDTAVMFSLDGIDDHFPLDTKGTTTIQISANQTFAQGFFISQGTTLYVKELGNPTTGSVYFTSFYGYKD